MDFETVAGELYGLLPDEFTSARSLRAREARSEGNRELATAISELRRPTIGAWLANQLMRERADQLAGLLGLGEAMRKAQEVEDGPELRRLSQQRRQMVTALVSEAKALARTRNQPVSENSSRELESTLEAGLADAAAADSLRSGRLAIGLDYSGLGPVGPPSPVVTKASRPTTQRSKPEQGKAKEAKSGQEGSSGAKARRRQADSTTARRPPQGEQSRLEQALAEAQSALVIVEDRVKATQEQVNEVQAERDRLGSKMDEVERLLRETGTALRKAEDRLTDTQRAEKAAEKEVIRAQRQRDTAEVLLRRFASNDG